LITKKFIFQFVNSYTSFFYLAFVAEGLGDCPPAGCMYALSINLTVVFGSILAAGVFMQLGYPYVMFYFKYQYSSRSTTSSASATSSLSAAAAATATTTTAAATTATTPMPSVTENSGDSVGPHRGEWGTAADQSQQPAALSRPELEHMLEVVRIG
jgi:hypothetical protein